jgi:hypothetical protein
LPPWNCQYNNVIGWHNHTETTAYRAFSSVMIPLYMRLEHGCTEGRSY